MATKAVLGRPLWMTSKKAPSAIATSARRTYTSSQRPINSCTPFRPTVPKSELQQSFRRSYAESVSPVTKRRGRGFFRWTWRFTYLSALGGLAYLSYTIYSIRTPQEQFEPDPSKKTLVILGTSDVRSSWQPLTPSRYRLGLYFAPEETRHGELQRSCYFSAQFLPIHTPATFMHDRHNRASIHHGAGPQHTATQKSYREVL